MVLYIKNMVCVRCIKSVAGIFHSVGSKVKDIKLGVVTLEENLDPAKRMIVQKKLEEEGFELIDDNRIRIVENIKNLIIELVHQKDLDEMKENLSDYLSKSLYKDYTYLSNLFSSVEPTTIEQFFILQKIEKVKEWLVYDQLSLSEMAFKLGYSSVPHLSSQFKKITGFTPGQFKKMKVHNRKKLDEI